MFLFEFLVLLVALILRFTIGIPIWIKIAISIGLVFVIPMYWYISKRPGPGAGDNLIGCTIGISIVELLKEKLKHTRLLLLLTDGEEIGQKGARHFVNSNIEELKAIKTSVINIDSIYNKDDITILRSDRNGFSKLSSSLNKSLTNIASERGYNPKIRPMPFGGGGTDGGQFARKGIDTTSIIGMPTNLIRKEILIHTKKDLPGRINGDAVSLVIEIVSEYIKTTDAAAEL
jgi:aminopeptidase YwaD